jgi:ATP-dependent Clp protease ATP-binding subunit ClpC
MFERYTESARRTLFFARYEASVLGATSIEPEHVLLGVTRESKGVTAKVFSAVRLTAEHVRAEVERRAVVRENIPTSVEMPFSEQTKRVLQFTVEEADRFRHSYIAPEHLLLGLLREEGSLAASILKDHSLSVGNVRDAIEHHLGEPFSGTETGTEAQTLPDAIERIKRLVEHLGRAEASPFQKSQMVDRIVRALDDIKRRLER